MSVHLYLYSGSRLHMTGSNLNIKKLYFDEFMEEIFKKKWEGCFK